MTSAGGEVAYSGGLGGFGESLARSSIACLVYAVARRKDLKQYRATLDYLKQRLEQTAMSYPEYCRYYEAQALFQGDIIAWEKWNKLLIRQLKQMQQADGSIPGQFGNDVGTAMSLLGPGAQLPVPADLRAITTPSGRRRPPVSSRMEMTRLPSILASGAAMVGLLTSAMVLAQVQTVDTPRGKRAILSIQVPREPADQPVITNETRRLRPTVEAASAVLSI